MDQDSAVSQSGAGAVAQEHSVAAGAGGVAVGRDARAITVVNVTYQGAQVTIPSLPAVTAHRAALRQRLEEDACRRWGGMAVYIQEEGATLPIEASPYQTGQLGPRQNLLHTLHTASRLLVLGEPGSGKTVALERLAWELCGDPQPAVPVLIRLFRYEGAPLGEWVRSFLQETGHLRLDDERALAAFLEEGQTRCFFLFDGLNEVPPGARERLVGELVRWMKAHPRHPTILTSRAQDELWRRLRDEVSQVVVVQPIAGEQARAYLVAHLAASGDTLYNRLDERLRAMAGTPLILWLIKEAGAAGESVPGNRGELYARFVSRMLRRDTDRRLDADIREAVKRAALADLAYHLGQGQRLACPRDEAVGVVARRLGEERAEAVVGACARHGLLAGEETLWFAPHQTVQEHFAALALRDLAQQEWRAGVWGRLRRAGRQLLDGRPGGVMGLAADDWWTETFVQLAGLVDDPNRLARDVARANPWLAWWCVEEGRAVDEATRAWVEERSIRLLRSERVSDRRRAVQALARMRSERAAAHLFRLAGGDDPEMAGLAARALLQMGEAVRSRALALAQQTEAPLYRAGLAYLEALLGQPVVFVPPGPFLMGSDKARNPQASDAELPQHTVTLPGYWIGRYPVTVARFRAFIEASGHQPADADSLKGPDDHPVVKVSWRDALAYCRWLADRSGLPVTLPSEAEWEKAARGADGRIYPWGDEPPDKERCNFDNPAGGTTPVGRYSPRGDSPYGCADMAGNVWEWTRTRSGFKYPYKAEDGREQLDDNGLRVVRGGSFDSSGWWVRCAVRYIGYPSYCSWSGGFRVVVVPVTL